MLFLDTQSLFQCFKFSPPDASHFDRNCQLSGMVFASPSSNLSFRLRLPVGIFHYLPKLELKPDLASTNLLSKNGEPGMLAIYLENQLKKELGFRKQFGICPVSGVFQRKIASNKNGNLRYFVEMMTLEQWHA